MLLNDLQLLWERSYSEQGVMEILRKEIPDSLIESSIQALMEFIPTYTTQEERWNRLLSQDLYVLVTDLWCYLLQLDNVTMTAVIAQVRHLIKGDEALNQVKTMGEIIFLFAQADLLDLNRGYEDQWVIGTHQEFDDAILAKIARIKYMPPMLVQPKKLHHYRDCAYLSLKDSGVILNNYMNNDAEYCLDNLNQFNKQVLKLNVEFLMRCNKDIPEDPNLAKFLKESWEIAADIINAGNEFFLTHKYDKRGRQYAQGYHINYQGDGYHKAMVEFEYSDHLTKEGLYWLKVDIANQYGLDKLPTFDARVDWVNQNIDQLESLACNIKEKDQPLYLKAVYTLRDHQAGLPVSHPAGLDAVFSGGQLWGVLTNCRTTCESVGLLGNTCIDPYLNLGSSLAGSFSRDDLKYSIMPHFYGSSIRPQQVFGNDIHKFYELMDDRMPGANQGRDLLINAWNPDALAHCWTLPDGFEVIIPSMVRTEHRVACLDGSSFTHVLKHNEPIKGSVCLPANVIQSFDGYIVREMRRRLPAHVPLICNHDCFKTHPNFVGLLNPTYAGILSDLAASDALQNVFDSLGIDVEVEHDEVLIDALKHAKYALA